MMSVAAGVALTVLAVPMAGKGSILAPRQD